VVRAASEAPSRVLGLNGGRGSLIPGSPADLIVADERLGARHVMRAGHWLDAA
jgi:N-acetylglucosamine-6-phosphate deacetylase